MSENDALVRFGSSIVGSAMAESVTLPFDVARVRLQLQTASGSARKYTGMVQTVGVIAKNEGFGGLFKGLQPALVRQCSYTPIAMVLYEPVRNILAGSETGNDVPVWKRLMAGGVSGGIGIAIVNPVEVVKTKMQAASGSGSSSMAEIFKQVWRAQGIRGLWAGITPNISRCFVVNAAELGSYDQAKTSIASKFGFDGLLLHVSASFCAGFCSATASTPIDVIKTRLQAQAGSGELVYKGPIHALTTIFRNEGFGALYSGFVPILARKTVWVTVFFVSYERLRPMFQSM